MSYMDFFNQFRTGMKKGSVFMENFERRVTKKLERFKKKLFATFFSFIFLLIGIIFFVVGIVLFLTRFFSLDLILIIAAVICIYIALLFNWMK